MISCRIVIQDEVNVKVENLPVEYRRKTGGNLGGRPKTSAKKEKLVLRLREEGESLRSIKDQTGVAVATIRRIIQSAELMKEGAKV